MITYPKALPAKERKKRLQQAKRFSYAEETLKINTIEALEEVLKDKTLTKEHKERLFSREKAIRSIVLEKDILNDDGIRSLTDLMSTVIFSDKDKIEIINSVRKAVIHKIYGKIYKNRWGSRLSINQVKAEDISGGFDNVME